MLVRLWYYTKRWDYIIKLLENEKILERMRVKSFSGKQYAYRKDARGRRTSWPKITKNTRSQILIESSLQRSSVIHEDTIIRAFYEEHGSVHNLTTTRRENMVPAWTTWSCVFNEWNMNFFFTWTKLEPRNSYLYEKLWKYNRFRKNFLICWFVRLLANKLCNGETKLLIIANSVVGELIGVHCTHGINRTGYLICRWAD